MKDLKILGKVLIGIGLYLASRNVVNLIFYILRLFLFVNLMDIHFTLLEITGEFLPFRVLLDFGSFAFIIAGFMILIQTNEKMIEKEYFNPQIVIGLFLGAVITIFSNQIYQYILYNIHFFRFNNLTIIFYIIKIIPYVLIVIGYLKLLGVKVGNDEKIINENTEGFSSVQPLPETKLKTKFTGGVLPIFLYTLWCPLFLVITLGFAFPWIICIIIRWVCENTTVGGKRLIFKGTGGSLFLNFILWTILIFITIGIYSFWAVRNYIRWIAENIEMVD
ncbi:MAG TPA: hypothetical protein DEQ14_07665 [Treponema sp.]|nr:hypothetical protein [Treponema sp.]